MWTYDHPNDFVIPKTSDYQKKQGQQNMEDKAIFLNRVPLDLLSIELYNDEHYCYGEWLLFLLTKEGLFCPKLFSNYEVDRSRS